MSAERARAIAVSRLSTRTGTRPAAARSAFSVRAIRASAALIVRSAAAVGAGRAPDAPRSRAAARAAPAKRRGDATIGGDSVVVARTRRPAGLTGDRAGFDDVSEDAQRTSKGEWLARPERAARMVRGVRPPLAGVATTDRPGPLGTVRDRCATMKTAQVEQHGSEEGMAAIRRAEATWSGDLQTGKGTVSAVTSGAFAELPVSWAARTEQADGRTSPEELVAAAHAA